MVDAFVAVEHVIAVDLNRRGIAPLVQHGSLHPATQMLLRSRRVAIATGFYIPTAGAPETDGPPGAAGTMILIGWVG